MDRRRAMSRSMILVALAALLLAAPAGAQQPGAGAPPPAGARPARPGKPGLEAKRQRVRQRIHALRANQLTRALGLDGPTATKVTAALGRWDQQVAGVRRRATQARQQLRQELRKPAPDAARINTLIDELLRQQRATWTLQEQRFQELRRLLAPAQAARLMVLLPEIDRRIQRKIQKIMRDGRGGRRQGPGARGPGPAGPGGAGPGDLVDPFSDPDAPAGPGQGRGRGRGKGAAPPPVADEDPDLDEPF